MAVLALRHVPFEDVGNLEALFNGLNLAVKYHDVWEPSAHLDSLLDDCELTVILGAPIGTSDISTYPFLRNELRMIEELLSNDRPVLGICLGAQLLAEVCGGSVRPGAPEIGFHNIELTPAGSLSCVRHMADVPVLHWHSDTIVPGETFKTLARTNHTPCQAFSVGSRALGLQFHPELNVDRIEQWLVGHAKELRDHDVDPTILRAQAAIAGPRLQDCSHRLFLEWLEHSGVPIPNRLQRTLNSAPILRSRPAAESSFSGFQ